MESYSLLAAEEFDKLIPKHITILSELNELEQNNIEDVIEWILWLRNIQPGKIFSGNFQNLLHKKMFVKVWK